MNRKTALIIGASPTGLTVALELLKHTGIKPIVIESNGDVGGISKTVLHNGNRMDIGGHCFFSKSDWVMHGCAAGRHRTQRFGGGRVNIRLPRRHTLVRGANRHLAHFGSRCQSAPWCCLGSLGEARDEQGIEPAIQSNRARIQNSVMRGS